MPFGTSVKIERGISIFTDAWYASSMAHERIRFAKDRIAKVCKYSAITGIIGQRQVGKTTLLEHVSSDYASFDRERVLLQAQSDPELFLQGRKLPFGIDEAQLCEKIFPALKERVRVAKSPGQFILSGSVRFTSKKSIRESLTGRIISVEVLPFTIAEASSEALPKTCERILRSKKESDLSFLSRQRPDRHAFARYLECGGLPGISFFRGFHIRADKFEAHLDTLLNRDIRQIYPTTLPYASLRGLLEYLAKNQGRPFELQRAQHASQISTVTLKKVLFAFEGLFLIRRIPSQGVARPTFFLEDQGTASWLKGTVLHDTDDLLRGLYANLRAEYHYRPELNVKTFQWRTRNGAEVPLVFSSRQGTIGFIPTLSRVPAPKILGSAQSFLKKFPEAKVVIAYDGKDLVCKSGSMFWVPYWWLC